MFKSILTVSSLMSVLIAPLGLAQENSNHCPATFYDLVLPDAIKQCRIFGVKKPSTISLFVVAAAEDVAKSLSQQLPNATNSRNGDMYTIVSYTPKYRVYVFKDGQGTQVNIRAE